MKNWRRILVTGLIAGMITVTGCSSNLPETNQGNRNGQRVVDAVNRRTDSYGLSRTRHTTTRARRAERDRGTHNTREYNRGITRGFRRAARNDGVVAHNYRHPGVVNETNRLPNRSSGANTAHRGRVGHTFGYNYGRTPGLNGAIEGYDLGQSAGTHSVAPNAQGQASANLNNRVVRSAPTRKATTAKTSSKATAPAPVRSSRPSANTTVTPTAKPKAANTVTRSAKPKVSNTTTRSAKPKVSNTVTRSAKPTISNTATRSAKPKVNNTATRSTTHKAAVTRSAKPRANKAAIRNAHPMMHNVNNVKPVTPVRPVANRQVLSSAPRQHSVTQRPLTTRSSRVNTAKPDNHGANRARSAKNGRRAFRRELAQGMHYNHYNNNIARNTGKVRRSVANNTTRRTANHAHNINRVAPQGLVNNQLHYNTNNDTCFNVHDGVVYNNGNCGPASGINRAVPASVTNDLNDYGFFKRHKQEKNDAVPLPSPSPGERVRPATRSVPSPAPVTSPVPAIPVPSGISDNYHDHEIAIPNRNNARSVDDLTRHIRNNIHNIDGSSECDGPYRTRDCGYDGQNLKPLPKSDSNKAPIRRSMHRLMK